MILLTFALPHESARFLPALQNKTWIQRGPLPVLTGIYDGFEIMVLHTGVGLEKARNRCAELLADHRPEFLISAGYGGGLVEELTSGCLVFAENFSDPALLARARKVAGGNAHVGTLTSQSNVAETPEAKKQLARDTGAVAVDMETEAIRAQCARFNIPMLSVRAISDPVGVGMPVPAKVWFDEIGQKPRILSLLAYLGRNPSRIPSFAAFVRGTCLARNELAAFLCAFLQQAPR